MNNVERDWSGSIEHTSYRLGRCSNTEEAQRSPRTPLSPHMLYTYSTGVSHYTTASHMLHSPYYLIITALHKAVMQYNGKAIETLGFT